MQRDQRFAWTWATAGMLGFVAGSALPEGANAQRFSAGRTPGDEKVTLPVGMGTGVEGFRLDLKEVPLTTAPKQYTIDVSRVRDRKVVGDFSGGIPWR